MVGLLWFLGLAFYFHVSIVPNARCASTRRALLLLIGVQFWSMCVPGPRCAGGGRPEASRQEARRGVEGIYYAFFLCSRGIYMNSMYLCMLDYFILERE